MSPDKVSCGRAERGGLTRVSGSAMHRIATNHFWLERRVPSIPLHAKATPTEPVASVLIRQEAVMRLAARQHSKATPLRP